MFRHLCACACVFIAAAAGCLAIPANVPSDRVQLLPADSLPAFTGPTLTPDASARIVPVTGRSFNDALQLTTRRQPHNQWDYQVGAATTSPVAKGDTLFASFWMRCVHGAGAGYGVTDVIFENATTYDKSVYFTCTAGARWQHFQVPFTAIENEPAGQGHLNFHMGFPPQVIEVGGVTLTDYGQAIAPSSLPRTELTYSGRSLDAPWRKAAAARIDRYRKGGLVVRVVDDHGRALPGATIHVQMVKQAFAFGTAVDMPFMANTPDGMMYRQMTYKLFNRVVPADHLKWGPWEERGSGYGRANALRLVAELRTHGMQVRGHNLVWPSWGYLPDDVRALRSNPAALSKRVDDHIRDEVGALKGQCVEWDVVNEPYANHDVMDLLGRSAMVDWYKTAHRADPAARLFINDYGITEDGGTDAAHIAAYADTIAYLLKNGAPLGGIGFQSHFADLLTAPDKVYAILNSFAKFGLPLEITEFDVNTPDEKLQADYWRDYLTICYSDPAVEGFMMWGFWEGDHWLPQAAPWRRDWSERPGAKVLTNLIKHQWWTDVKGSSGANGRYSTRVFLGDYKITVARGATRNILSAKVTRNENGQTTVVVKM